MRIVPRASLTGVLGLVICLCLGAEELLVRLAGDHLRVTAPKLSFLTGKPLERLRDGHSVAFNMQLSALGESKTSVLRRSFERCVVSYDLWEEKFSVTRMRSSPSSASRLSAKAAEQWCVDNVSLPSAGLPQDRSIWIRLEIHAQGPKDPPLLSDDDSVSLSALVEIFSRVTKAQPSNSWKVEAGPLKIADLPKDQARARGGD